MSNPNATGGNRNPTGKNGWDRERRTARQLIVDTYLKSSIDGVGALSLGAKDERVKLEACKWLAEQILGKAQQAITGPDGEPIKIDVNSLAGNLKKLAGE